MPPSHPASPGPPSSPSAHAALTPTPLSSLPRSTRSLPPDSVLHAGCAALHPSTMQRLRLSIAQPLLLTGGSSRTATRAWPCAAVGARSIALDACALRDLAGADGVRVRGLRGDEVDEASLVRVRGAGAGDEVAAGVGALLRGRYFCVGAAVRVGWGGREAWAEVAGVDAVLGGEVFVGGVGTVVEVEGGEDGGGMEDVGGLADEVGEVLRLARAAFGKGGARRPRGVLLHGPPGTGKTMVARCVARALGARMRVVRGPDVVRAEAGGSEGAVRAAWRRAARAAPCVLVLDEVDVLVPRRDGAGVGSAERRLAAALLVLMDGGGGADGVFVVGTTNVVDGVDPAMRRAGRFDREVEVGVPGVAGRADILRRMTRTAREAGRMDVAEEEVAEVARVAHGFVGADLAALWREAAASALRRGGGVVRADFDAALRVVRPSALREVHVEVPAVRWCDVGGSADAKRRLREAVELPLSRAGAALLARVGVSPPRGVLLYGPPGCSKTLLAKAVATESRANFVSVKGPELLSKFVGDSEKAVRATFRRAHAAAPCVVFFDEIDALAPARGAGGGAQARVVGQLLTEIDGLGDGVVVVAATNRPDALDAALVRPGRLGCRVYVGLPEAEARGEIFDVHLRGVPVEDVGVAELVRRSEGMSGAEIAAVVREAALEAIAEDGEVERVEMRHFDRALERVRPRTSAETITFFEEYRKAAASVRR